MAGGVRREMGATLRTLAFALSDMGSQWKVLRKEGNQRRHVLKDPSG